ncbi:MAG TPA: peptide chain release factor 3 [Thermoanaerobaculia bacterium]|nr:peptide chain release factor 3 [Thermoanaerobaculia bacterium]
MAEDARTLAAEVARRRTFAIISHPDAGKTTLTEKLLLYGGAIHLAGSVKTRKNQRHTTSDWMELERQRGISITTSVLQFPYRGHHVNLLDTPGHNDFSEDTYRTLAAADAAVMLVDSAKGVEPQTIKLFEVCRMRRIPIVTFVNKLDRAGKDPLDLMDEIERVLGIPCHPVTWPIGSGPDFQGVYDRWGKTLLRYERGDFSAKGEKVAPVNVTSVDDAGFVESIGARVHATLREELELLEAGHPFDRGTFLGGGVTPVFFGSAVNDFGVEPFLQRFLDLAPPPLPRASSEGVVEPLLPRFSGFVFKIQANMDPAHRDRVAFVRVVSGKFTRGMEATHARTGKTLRLAKPLQFLAQERTLVEEAWAGDILGLWDPGNLRIGDSLAEGSAIEYEGIPRFSPEHFNRVVMLDPARRKQLKKGLDQLSEEGAVQVFLDPGRLERDPVLGAVGVLQFEVIQHRLRAEYGAEISYARLPFTLARWVEGEGFDPARFDDPPSVASLVDLEGRPLVLFQSPWHLERAQKENPKLAFVAAVQPGRARAGAV